MLERLTAKLLIVGLIGSLTLFSFACGGSDTVPDETPSADEPAQEESSVVMYQYRFNPNSLEVRPGTTIVFENRDPESHNISIPALDVDQNIEPNQDWTYTFDTEGEFAVGNRFSDGMKLDLVVE